MNKLFTVIIDNKEYDVFRIESMEHQGIGKTPKNWWVYYSDIKNQDGLFDYSLFVPYNNEIINKYQWDIRVNQVNYSNTIGEDIFFGSKVSIELWCNKKKIYAFNSINTIENAVAEAIHLKNVIINHPFDFFCPANENNGRKIYFYGLPAIISVSKINSWEIDIIPDYYDLPADKWWIEFYNRSSKIPHKEGDIEQLEDHDYEIGIINWGDVLYDKPIDWFRD